MTLPYEFWLWAKWCDQGKPKGKLDPRVPRWLKAHTRWGIVPLAWHVRYRLHKGVPPTNPPIPPPPTPGSKFRYGLCMAQNPLEALKARGPYKVWFTADPGYDGWATRGAADACRAAGKEPFVWYVPTQVSRSRAEEVAQRLGCGTIIGQCETADEFDASWNQGCRAVIGSLSPLREDQLAKIRSGEIQIVLEHYWNLQPHLQIDFKNLPVASVCVAVYDGSGEQPGAGWRPSLADYINNNRFPPGSGVYGPGMTDADWQVLPPCPG